MPEMGESVTEGTVLEWHVSEGDSVEEGQTMVEVSTDKVDAEVPAPASGTVTKILRPGRRGRRGRQAARRDRPQRRRARRPRQDEQEKPRAEGEAAAESNGAGATAEEQAAERRQGDHGRRLGLRRQALEGGGLEIVMPEMGESVTEGTVLEWHVAEGDASRRATPSSRSRPTRSTPRCPPPPRGTITKILVGPDETIEVGKPLGRDGQGRGAPSGRRRRDKAPPSRPTRHAGREAEDVPADGEADGQGPRPPRWPAAPPRPTAST